MDPDANLREQIELAKRIIAEADKDHVSIEDPIGLYVGLEMVALRLSELVIALDEWMRAGGFRPSTWRAKQ